MGLHLSAYGLKTAHNSDFLMSHNLRVTEQKTEPKYALAAGSQAKALKLPQNSYN